MTQRTFFRVNYYQSRQETTSMEIVEGKFTVVSVEREQPYPAQAPSGSKALNPKPEPKEET